MILNTYVSTVDPDGLPVILPPGLAPEWAKDAITVKSVWGDPSAPVVAQDAAATMEAEEASDEVVAEKPAGNASRDLWAAFALAQGFASSDLEGQSRDEIRALFS